MSNKFEELASKLASNMQEITQAVKTIADDTKSDVQTLTSMATSDISNVTQIVLSDIQEISGAILDNSITLVSTVETSLDTLKDTAMTNPIAVPQVAASESVEVVQAVVSGVLDVVDIVSDNAQQLAEVVIDDAIDLVRETADDAIDFTRKIVNIKHQFIPVDVMYKKALRRSALSRGQPIAKPAHPLPAKANLKAKQTFVYDQGDLGSCTANAFCAAFRIRAAYQNVYKNFLPSRLYFYYKERAIEGTINEDAGAYIIDGETYVKQHGICSERLWPYNISKFTVKPPASCDTEAKNFKIKSFATIDNDSNLLVNIRRLINAQTPILYAFLVYESFESEQVALTGVVPMPDVNTEECLGGHAVLLFGYDDTTHRCLCLNSWSKDWGQNGLFTIPYDYLTDINLSIDFSYIGF
jgi:hypothetical protein